MYNHNCDCDCHDEIESMSLPEFLDTNDHHDSEALKDFLQFFKNYFDDNIYDPDWYTRERLLEKFNKLGV